MNTKLRLAQLEEEATLFDRVEKVFDTNPEYLKLSMELFFNKYESLLQDGQINQDKLKALRCLDCNFQIMSSLLGVCFDKAGNECLKGSDLNKHFSIEDGRELKKAFIGDVGKAQTAGIISPEGVFYPAQKSHYLLCSWLMLKGIDLRQYIRSTHGANGHLLFADLSDYIRMDKEKDFVITPEQVRAMKTLNRIHTNDKNLVPFHNIVEESHKLGFCKFESSYNTRKQIGLFEDVLGKREVDSGEILSSRVKY